MTDSDGTPPAAPGGPAEVPPDIPPGRMRVSDAERQAAVRALGDHHDAGRLSLSEYDERSSRAIAARTVDDLDAVFDDLPGPRPVSPADPVLRRPAPQPATITQADRRSTAQKIVGGAAAASVFVALVLFFLTDLWYWFLLIPAISAIAGGIWGPDWNDRGDGRRR